MRLFSAILLLSFSLTAHAGLPAKVDAYAMKAERVADGVWAVISPATSFPNVENKGWNSNSAFVETSDGLLVFDTGSSETIGKALLKAIRTVSDKPIKWVINSHSHGDHWLGNGAFVSEKPEEMIASDVAIAKMGEMGYEWVDRFHSMTGGLTGRFEPVPASDGVAAAMTRKFGGVEVHILFSGNSHSPGDIVFWLPGKGVMLTGDTLYTKRPPATFDADVRQWISFLGEMAALEPTVTIPGHGPVSDVSALTNLQDYFQTLWDMVAEGYDEGQADFEMAPAIKAEMKRFEGRYPGLFERLGESISHVYLQVEEAAFE